MSEDKKVVSLSEAREKEKKEEKTEEELDFAEIMKKNEENKRRVEKERLKHNKSVTRSHRLKK